ncbi:hypothetical protein [Shouchella clausii]|uniref:hypothetical protein n=1 Tax=Shouchella clausii TaxID=79880 RepID=UPI001C73D88A|nr:hypothetical protein [Shouchella clausii]MBX0320280.1 hypothetical protein [Shouchella clausii]MEB5480955.1 hypothetical protein [Shouchella clausii]
MTWNYRVVKEKKLTETEQEYEDFRVVEVYYNDIGEIEAWSDCPDIILKDWDDYEDLKETAKAVVHAFSEPVLIVNGVNLEECKEGVNE